MKWLEHCSGSSKDFSIYSSLPHTFCHLELPPMLYTFLFSKSEAVAPKFAEAEDSLNSLKQQLAEIVAHGTTSSLKTLKNQLSLMCALSPVCC